MPLYKPKFLNPNANTGQAVVDVSLPFQPSCAIDGNVPVGAYEIEILKLTDDGYILNVYTGEISCTEDGVLIPPADKPPSGSYLIYYHEVNDFSNEQWFLASLDGDGHLASSAAEGAAFVSGKTYEVQYIYITSQAFYTTGKQTLEEPFYPVDSRGGHNVFTPPAGISFDDFPEDYLTSEYVECVKDKELTLKNEIASKTDMVIYKSNPDIEFLGLGYENIPLTAITVSNNKITYTGGLDRIEKGHYYAVVYRAKNVATEPYKYAMRFWDSENTTDDPSVSSDFAVFYANGLPNVTLYADGEEITGGTVSINKRSCTFSVDYQDAYSSIKWFGWKLTNQATGEVIEDSVTKNHIYGAAGNIRFAYDGFTSEQAYSIVFMVTTQNGMSVTVSAAIEVSYRTEEITAAFSAVSLPRECGILCDWSSVNVSYGREYGVLRYMDDYPAYGSASAVLSEGTYIHFYKSDASNFSVRDSSYILLSFQYRGKADFQDMKLFTLTGTDIHNNLVEKTLFVNSYSMLESRISVNGAVVSSAVSSNSVFGEPYWNFVLLKPGGNMCEVIYEAENALPPSETLTASDDLTPDMGTWNVSAAEEFTRSLTGTLDLPFDVSYTDLVIGDTNNALPFVCDFMYVSPDEVKQEDITAHFVTDGDGGLAGTFEFYPKFNHDLNAGNTFIESLDEFEIRRKKNAGTVTEFVANLSSINLNFVIDYLVSNQTTYSYYLYPKNENSIMYPIRSGDIKTNWWHHCLMVVDESGTEGLYYLSKMFLFALNVETGDMSNNTDIEVTKNFTPYPFVQASPSNYWSGSLSSLIGYISCGKTIAYTQTPQMLAELKALTTDTRRKFLKDIEGNLFEVQLASDIAVSNDDDLAEQAKTVTMNWVEVGDVSGVSVINNPDLQVNTWLLTETGVPAVYRNYVWDDGRVWDDLDVWTESQLPMT